MVSSYTVSAVTDRWREWPAGYLVRLDDSGQLGGEVDVALVGWVIDVDQDTPFSIWLVEVVIRVSSAALLRPHLFLFLFVVFLLLLLLLLIGRSSAGVEGVIFA